MPGLVERLCGRVKIGGEFLPSRRPHLLTYLFFAATWNCSLFEVSQIFTVRGGGATIRLKSVGNRRYSSLQLFGICPLPCYLYSRPLFRASYAYVDHEYGFGME